MPVKTKNVYIKILKAILKPESKLPVGTYIIASEDKDRNTLVLEQLGTKHRQEVSVFFLQEILRAGIADLSAQPPDAD